MWLEDVRDENRSSANSGPELLRPWMRMMVCVWVDKEGSIQRGGKESEDILQGANAMVTLCDFIDAA